MSAIYLPFLDARNDGNIDIVSGDIRALLVDSTYVFDETHTYLSSVGGGSRIGTAVALTSKVSVNGVYTCDSPITFTGLGAFDGTTAVAMIIYSHDGGADSARRLIAYLDTGYNLPLDLNGNDVDMEVDGVDGLMVEEVAN